VAQSIVAGKNYLRREGLFSISRQNVPTLGGHLRKPFLAQVTMLDLVAISQMEQVNIGDLPPKFDP